MNDVKNPEAKTEDKVASTKPLEELSQEELLDHAKEQDEKLGKAEKKASDQEGRAQKAEDKLKGVGDAVAEPKTEEKSEEPKAVTQEQLADNTALLQSGINHPQDVEALNKYKGTMTMAEALADPNIIQILATNKSDRKAKEQSDGMNGISGGQTTLTDKQFVESVQADPSKLASLSAKDRQRFGKLLAQS